KIMEKTLKACRIISQDSERGKGSNRVFQIHYSRTFTDANTECTQEDVPQIKTQLVLHVCEKVAANSPILDLLLEWSEKSDTTFFVCVACSNTNSNRKHRDIHHNHQAELYAGMDLCEIEDSGAGMAGGSRLVNCGENTRADRERINGR